MTELLVFAAIVGGGMVGVVLRRRSGKRDTPGPVLKEDRTEAGVHQGFPNHHG